MARLNETGQWIILMAYIICAILLILAIIINESAIVGQSTAEGVLEFSKSDIQDLKNEVLRVHEVNYNGTDCDAINLSKSINDIEELSGKRKNALVDISIGQSEITIHFNNGVNEYDERHYL
jgi:predicted secreted protein